MFFKKEIFLSLNYSLSLLGGFLSLLWPRSPPAALGCCPSPWPLCFFIFPVRPT